MTHTHTLSMQINARQHELLTQFQHREVSLFSSGQAAIKNSHNTVHLLQRDVQVNHNAGIFITLNPATKGYGGRQKLPDNLKQLFRPVVFSVGSFYFVAFEALWFSVVLWFQAVLLIIMGAVSCSVLVCYLPRWP